MQLELDLVTQLLSATSLDISQECLHDAHYRLMKDFLPLVSLHQTRIFRHHRQLLKFLANVGQDKSLVFELLDLFGFPLTYLFSCHNTGRLHHHLKLRRWNPLGQVLICLKLCCHKEECLREALFEQLHSVHIIPCTATTAIECVLLCIVSHLSEKSMDAYKNGVEGLMILILELSSGLFVVG